MNFVTCKVFISTDIDLGHVEDLEGLRAFLVFSDRLKEGVERAYVFFLFHLLFFY